MNPLIVASSNSKAVMRIQEIAKKLGRRELALKVKSGSFLKYKHWVAFIISIVCKLFRMEFIQDIYFSFYSRTFL